MKKTDLVYCILLILLATFPNSGQAIERRKPQFQTEPGYLIFPLPISLPGIGDMVVVTALAGNMFETNIDAYVLGITGDVEGLGFAVQDIHLLPETLILEVFGQNLSKATFNNYSSRGMDSDAEDYTLIEATKIFSQGTTLTLTLFDRRFELFGTISKQAVSIPRIRDSKGNLISELSPVYHSESQSTVFGTMIDYTDDRQDPRKGARLQASRSFTPSDSVDSPEVFVWDYNFTGYIPVGKLSTIVINYFQSDADVIREGQTDLNILEQELGIECSGDPDCVTARDELVQMFWSGNKYGTASSLGGDVRLRGYPGSRFQGAHTRFYGAEFRWNLSEGTQPFDWWVWKDVRTGSQVAFFYETGTVADIVEELGDLSRSAYGFGYRLVTASGFVYRAELAQGDEGMSTIIIFDYPW